MNKLPKVAQVLARKARERAATITPGTTTLFSKNGVEVSRTVYTDLTFQLEIGVDFDGEMTHVGSVYVTPHTSAVRPFSISGYPIPVHQIAAFAEALVLVSTLAPKTQPA